MSHRLRMSILSAVVYSLVVSFTLPSKTEAVPGDINLDGVVDFDDFFLLADHFGESGIPEDLPDTVLVTVLDTVIVTRIESVDGLNVSPRSMGTQSFSELGLTVSIDWRPLDFCENDRLCISYIVEWDNQSGTDVNVDYSLLFLDEFGFRAGHQGFTDLDVPAGGARTIRVI